MKLKVLDFKILEYLAFWQERLTGTRLAEILSVDRTYAHRAVLAPYRSTSGIILTKHKRAYAFPRPGKPFHGPSTINDLFRFLDGLAVLREMTGDDLGVPFESAHLDIPMLSSVEEFRMLYSCCARRVPAIIEYASRRRVSSLTFSPHALIRTSSRPHFRGYARSSDSDSGYYTDLVPARVIAIQEGNPGEYVGSTNDADWHRKIDLEFKLSDDLPSGLRRAVQQEYEGHPGFNDDRLTIRSVRTAIATYVRRHLRYRVFEDEPISVWVDAEKADPTE